MLKRDFGIISVRIDLLTGLAHCYFMLYLRVPYFEVYNLLDRNIGNSYPGEKKFHKINFLEVRCFI